MADQTVLVAQGTWAFEQAVAAAHRDRIKDAVIGLTRYPRGRCWRVCCSWHGASPTWVSNHRRKADAAAQVVRLQLLLCEGGITDDATFNIAIQHLAAYSDAELEDLEAQQRQCTLDYIKRYRAAQHA